MQPKYRQMCRKEGCHRHKRDGDILCYKCYMRLPKAMRDKLWEEDVSILKGNITLALTWLEENPETRAWS